MAVSATPLRRRTMFRDLDSEELQAAQAELRRRIAVLTDTGISVREAELRVISQQTVPIVEGEPVADTALRFGILPEQAPLGPDEIRQLLRECVTVVKPGETLVIMVPLTWTPDQVDRYARTVDDVNRALDLPIRTLVVPAEELAVVEAPP